MAANRTRYEIEEKVAGPKFVVVEVGPDGRKRILSKHKTRELAHKALRWEIEMDARELTRKLSHLGATNGAGREREPGEDG